MIFDIPVRLSGKIPTPAFKRRRFVISVKTEGIECPVCGCRASVVTDSRRTDQGKKRRRSCSACAIRFTTLESVVQGT